MVEAGSCFDFRNLRSYTRLQAQLVYTTHHNTGSCKSITADMYKPYLASLVVRSLIRIVGCPSQSNVWAEGIQIGPSW